VHSFTGWQKLQRLLTRNLLFFGSMEVSLAKFLLYIPLKHLVYFLGYHLDLNYFNWIIQQKLSCDRS
jgi:hypothetical protein